MTDTTNIQADDLTGPEPKTTKRTTQKDINALLAAFVPQKAEAESKASRVRRERHREIDRLFAGIVADLTEDPSVMDVGDPTPVVITDGDLALAEKTLKGLAAARAAAHKAVDSIPDVKLDPEAKPAAKATKTARVSVPKISSETKPAPTLGEQLQVATADASQTEPLDGADDDRNFPPKTQAERDAEIDELIATDKAKAATDDGGPRGLVDPNEGEGF